MESSGRSFTPDRPFVRELPREALDAWLEGRGLRPFQLRQVHEQIFRRGIRDPMAATNLSKELRQELETAFRFRCAEIVERSESRDGTVKYLLELLDGEKIEMVRIPEGSRVTLCISTQVGCPVACVFCASGLAGVRRNLRTAEIIEQFLIGREESGPDQITNLVVMGMGEPMLNLENLMRALEQITADWGLGFSQRRVTISCSGYPDRIRELAHSGQRYELAVSLHAADRALRRELVPMVQSGPGELVAAAREHFAATGREPTFELVLLKGKNDDARAADALIRLLRGTQCMVNLIPWNPVPGIELETPRDADVDSFQERLTRAGFRVTVRRHRGRDRDAACGQLRLRQES